MGRPAGCYSWNGRLWRFGDPAEHELPGHLRRVTWPPHKKLPRELARRLIECLAEDPGLRRELREAMAQV